MLLRVTTHSKQILLRVKDDPVYRASSVDLPAGTYLFRRIANPFNVDWSDWLALDQSHLPLLQLEPSTIVGLSYEHAMFCHSLVPGPNFCGFPSMTIDVQDITPSAVNEEPAVTAEQMPVVKLPTNIIPWPMAPYPQFIRHDPPRRRLVQTVTIHDRLKRLHPAARRAC